MKEIFFMTDRIKRVLKLIVSSIGGGFLTVNIVLATPYVDYPSESDEQLRTPGVGFQEQIGRMPAQSRLDNGSYDTSLDSTNENDVKAGSVYVRMMWQDFEPTEGGYSFSKLDQIFACARNKGQTVDLRVMLGNYLPLY